MSKSVFDVWKMSGKTKEHIFRCYDLTEAEKVAKMYWSKSKENISSSLNRWVKNIFRDNEIEKEKNEVRHYTYYDCNGSELWISIELGK